MSNLNEDFLTMLGRKTIFILISQIILQAINSITFFLAVKTFSVESFGYREAAIAILTLFRIISMLSFYTANIQMMSQSDDKNKIFTHFLVIKLILVISGITLTFLFLYFQISINLRYDSSEQLELLSIFSIIFVGFVFDSFTDIFSSSFIALQKVVRKQLTFILGTLIGSLVSLASIFIFKNFLIFILGTLIKSIIILVIFLFYIRDFKITKIELGLLKKYFAISSILYIPILLNLLSDNLGIFIFLQYYDEELLGVYSIFTNLFGLISNLELSLIVLFIPNFNKFIKEGKNNKISNLLNQFQKYVLTFTTLLIISGFILSEFLINTLLGNIYYEKGLILFSVYLLALLLFPTRMGYWKLLIANNNLKYFIFISIGNLVFSILSWIFLIPIFNIVAIKLGTYIFDIFTIPLLRYKSYKELKVGNIKTEEIIQAVLIFVFIAFSFFVSIIYLELIVKIILVIIISSLFVISQFLLRILTLNDVKFFYDVFNPKKMLELIFFREKNVEIE